MAGKHTLEHKGKMAIRRVGQNARAPGFTPITKKGTVWHKEARKAELAKSLKELRRSRKWREKAIATEEPMRIIVANPELIAQSLVNGVV